jgi:peptidoglycan/LPS O-acetylase OafA/YrhL
MPSTKNNFDLIRLLAAIQVFIGHAFLFNIFRENWVSVVIWFIPGVPVFFGMSGFLLLWSFERNPDVLTYLKNRVLRLYPALWVVMLLTAIILLGFHGLSLRELFGTSSLLYFIGRCTVIFYFVPAVIRRWVQTDPNGSLWTIGVELQFYLLLPTIYLSLRRRPLFIKNVILITIGAASWWIDVRNPALPFDVSRLNGYLQVFISEIRIFYYLFFFVIGMLFYINFGHLRKWLEGRAAGYFLLYVIVCYLSFRLTNLSQVDRYAPDPFSLLRHILLMLLVFSAAFSRTRLSERLLKGNDYSYGVYLAHLLVLNTFLHLHRFSGPVNFLLSALSTAVLAYLSWHCIEKRALKLKRHSLRAIFRKPTTNLPTIKTPV